MQAFSFFPLLLTISSGLGASPSNGPLVFHPLVVRADARSATQMTDASGRIPDEFLPVKVHCSLRAYNPEDAEATLFRVMDNAMSKFGLVRLDPSEQAMRLPIRGDSNLQDRVAYLCADARTMERLRHRLLFTLEGQQLALLGEIRQVLVSFVQTPKTWSPNQENGHWEEDLGIRVFVVGMRLDASTDLKFDPRPLMEDLKREVESTLLRQ